MLAYFNTWCVEDTRKKQVHVWPWKKKIEGPYFFLIPGAQMTLEILGLFWSLNAGLFCSELIELQEYS